MRHTNIIFLIGYKISSHIFNRKNVIKCDDKRTYLLQRQYKAVKNRYYVTHSTDLLYISIKIADYSAIFDHTVILQICSS